MNLSLKLIVLNILFRLIIGSSISIFAQNPEIEDLMEQFAAKNGLEQADFSTYIENLTYYYNNPLNLNEANVENLEKLYFLDDYQIQNLLNYITKVGEMQTIYELQYIKGFDLNTIKTIRPFVTVGTVKKEGKLKFGTIFKYGKNRLIAENKFYIQTQKAYLTNDSMEQVSSNNHYLGDRQKLLFRYRFNYKDKVFAGITAEKDPGEAFYFNNNQYGFDFYSTHLQLNNLGVFKTIVIGDYHPMFGQGLIAWSGFSLGKSSNVLNIRKKNQGLRRYTSTNENLFMRGVGATIQLKDFEFTSFLSDKKIDGNSFSQDSLNDIPLSITSLQNTGYHRTPLELEKRKLVNEFVFGSRLSFRKEKFMLALNFIGYQYNYPIEISGKPYKYFDFNGLRNFNYSIDYQYFLPNVTFFGETAVGQNFALATLNGIVINLVPQLGFSVVQRYYQEKYQAYYAAAFGENSRIKNEQGIYYGILFHPYRNIQISAYYDSYSFFWLKYSVNAPSYGNDILLQINYIATRNMDMYFRWKKETKLHNERNYEQNIIPLAAEGKQYFRFHINYSVLKNIKLRNRIEFSTYNLGKNLETGFLAYQDINYSLPEFLLNFYFRFAVFDATYNARLYAYENDLLYNFSIPAYFGVGSRIYLMVKYEINKHITFRLRYADFLYTDRNKISSGLNEILGNMASELKFQVILKF